MACHQHAQWKFIWIRLPQRKKQICLMLEYYFNWILHAFFWWILITISNLVVYCWNSTATFLFPLHTLAIYTDFIISLFILSLHTTHTDDDAYFHPTKNYYRCCYCCCCCKRKLFSFLTFAVIRFCAHFIEIMMRIF